MGYDTPRKLGDRETGGGLSAAGLDRLHADARSRACRCRSRRRPKAWCNVGGEWYYDEYARGGGVRSLGLERQRAAPRTPPSDAEERDRACLDLFRR